MKISDQLDHEIAFAQNVNPSQMLWVFESLPEICFFTKDLNGSFTQCNQATLKLFGLKNKFELIGKTDYDIANDEIANQYRALDQKIFTTKQPELNQIEPVPNTKGDLQWVSTTKVPLFNHAQKVIGIAVIIKNLSELGVLLGPYQQLNPCLEYIFKNYRLQIKIETLAKLAGLSTRQLERQFKKLFKQTPIQYINHYRVQIACSKLKESHVDISKIAKDLGFYDHSHFIRLFKSMIKVTPSEYRKSFSK